MALIYLVPSSRILLLVILWKLVQGHIPVCKMWKQGECSIRPLWIFDYKGLELSQCGISLRLSTNGMLSQ